MDVKDKIAIITGAGTGIGRATAMDLAEHGCVTALVGRRESKLAETLKELQKHSPASTLHPCDVSDRAQVEQMVQSVREQHGRIDIIINNAGIMIVKPFAEMSEDELSKQVEINFFGAVSLIRAVVPVMEKQGKGAIVNVTSSDSKLVVPGTNVYAATKAALNAFSESLYYELKGKGIHVGIVLAGGTRTELFDSVTNRLGEFYRDHSQMPPAKVAKQIRKALEKERFETVTPFSDKVYIAFHGALPGVFRRFVLQKLRPYF
jgi:short-subunit dehydrogenase